MYDRNYFRHGRLLTRHQLAKLHTFTAVARHQSFALAANELCLTPAAISHQINQLEDELGFKLFKRYHRRIELNPDGKKLFGTLQKVLYKLNQDVLDIKNREISGQLTVYCRPSIAQCWLVPRLYKFCHDHPHISLNILTGNEFIDFNRHRIDLAIYYDKLTHDELFCCELMPEHIVPVCSALYAEKHNLHNNPSNLPYCTFIHDSQAWEYNSLFNEWQEWAEDCNLNYDFTRLKSVLFDRSDLAIIAAENHMGMAMGRLCLIDASLATGKLIIPFPELQRPCRQRYYVVTPSIETPKINIFIEWLKAEV